MKRIVKKQEIFTLIVSEKVKSLIDNSAMSSANKKNAYWFIALLQWKAHVREREQQDWQYVPLHRNYFRKVFGGRYHTWLSDLKRLGIVQVKEGLSRESYQVGGCCKEYRLNPVLESIHLVSVTWKSTRRSRTNQLIIDGDDFTSTFLDDLAVLRIDISRLNAVAHASATKISIKVNEEIDDIVVNLCGKIPFFYKGYIRRDVCIKKARKHGLALIQDDRRFFIDDPIKYRERKQQYKLHSYLRSIRALHDKAGIYLGRAKTNGRVHHNFTELSGDLLHVIIVDNDLCEIDLACSQFALLSYWMEHEGIRTADFAVFAELAGTGKLYEFIGEEFGISRSEAKMSMMELAFSSWRNNTIRKKRLKQLFPSVVSVIDNYKKQRKDEEFAIALQQLESGLFIDTFYPEIKREFGFVITRHDSFLVKADDAEFIVRFLKEVCKDAGFKCMFKVKQRSK